MKVESTEYQEHIVFKTIIDFQEFYESFSESIMSFTTMGIDVLFSIDTYVYSSMSCTLSSMHSILKAGHINDAYALLRKFYDSVIMNIYSTVYLQEHFNIETMAVDQIQNWVSGKEGMPNYRKMNDYLQRSKSVEQIFVLLSKDDRYKKIRTRCTDNMHYNFYWNVMLNDSKIYNEHRLKYLNRFEQDLKQLVLMHISYIFFSNEIYMSSSDYLDNLEMGIEPGEDSQYWVAPFIQEIFDQLVKKERPDIAQLILENTIMKLE